jgi:hypothetical protein
MCEQLGGKGKEKGREKKISRFHLTPYGGPPEWQRRRDWLFSSGCECAVRAGGRAGTWGCVRATRRANEIFGELSRKRGEGIWE